MTAAPTMRDLHAAIGNTWPDVLARLGVPDAQLVRKPGPCPACGGTDRYTFDNRTGRGDFFCRQCGPGDGFALLMRVHGWSAKDARREVLECIGLTDTAQQQERRPVRAVIPPSPAAAVCSSLRGYGRELWDACRPIEGEARAYLAARRCVIPPRDGDVRWHRALRHPSGYEGPALVALVTHAATGAPLTLHRTWVRPDGRKAAVEPPRLLLKGHRKAGGVIRLWPDECVTTGLAIGEGIETCLVAAHAFTPVWGAIDAGNLATLPVLPGLEALTLIADHDPAGIAAAEMCGQRWADAGRDVTLVLPERPGTDLADAVAA